MTTRWIFSCLESHSCEQTELTSQNQQQGSSREREKETPLLSQPFETAAGGARHVTLPCGRHDLLNIGGRDALTIQLLVQGEIPSAARKQPGKLFSHIITLPPFLLPLSCPHSSFLPLQATRPPSSHTKAVHQLEGHGRCSCCSGHLTCSPVVVRFSLTAT